MRYQHSSINKIHSIVAIKNLKFSFDFSEQKETRSNQLIRLNALGALHEWVKLFEPSISWNKLYSVEILGFTHCKDKIMVFKNYMICEKKKKLSNLQTSFKTLPLDSCEQHDISDDTNFYPICMP